MGKVVIVSVTYGERWKYLSVVLEGVIHDIHLERFVLVDNGSVQEKELQAAQEKYKGTLEVIRIEKNIGSAGGFAVGLERAREIECEYVLMLDDDNLLEQNGLSTFIHIYKSIPGRHMVCGYRPDIQNEEVFHSPTDTSELKYTFFDVWNISKIKSFFQKRRMRMWKNSRRTYQSVVATKGFVYGGAFLPMAAVRAAPLPDKELVLYGDDVEYSWGVLEHGYRSYLSDRPIIRDLDMSFEEGDHVLGLFNKNTKPFKVYYRIRNMVRISLRNSTQSFVALHSSIILWILGLILLGLVKFGINATTRARIKLIFQALYGGYVKSTSVPPEAKLP